MLVSTLIGIVFIGGFIGYLRVDRPPRPSRFGPTPRASPGASAAVSR